MSLEHRKIILIVIIHPGTEGITHQKINGPKNKEADQDQVIILEEIIMIQSSIHVPIRSKMVS